jgi:hypothetical protein
MNKKDIQIHLDGWPTVCPSVIRNTHNYFIITKHSGDLIIFTQITGRA